MKYFKRIPWILPIIGGFIALISVFTPATTWRPALGYGWMFQMALRVEPYI